MTHNHSGNILWIILVSIALIGAVTATFTRSSSTSDDTGEYENYVIQVNAINRFAAAVATGIDNLLIKGCSENDLNFANSTYTTFDGTILYAQGHNSNSPSDFQCNIFHQNGAGISPYIIPERYVSSTASGTASGHARIRNAAIPDVGEDSQQDLYLHFQKVGTPLCKAYNRAVGVDTPGDSIPSYTMSGAGSMEYDGSFGGRIVDDVDGHLAGHEAFCATFSGDNYIFYTILVR